MAAAFADLLSGGHPNSLGRTEEVVATVLADHHRLDELFATIRTDDAVVRMRVGDALEKICRARPDWFVPHVERILGELGDLDQPSVRWHVAQLLQHLRGDLTMSQAQRATRLLRANLAASTDWIVLNVTMDVLTGWARDDPPLTHWLAPELERLSQDSRRSVAGRARRHRSQLGR